MGVTALFLILAIASRYQQIKHAFDSFCYGPQLQVLRVIWRTVCGAVLRYVMDGVKVLHGATIPYGNIPSKETVHVLFISIFGYVLPTWCHL